ncbi:MAG: amidohydrolase family protein [Geodermatophilaceae bacterium]
MRAVDAGIDIVAHCNWLGPDPGTVLLDEPTIKRMAQDGVIVDLNVQGATPAPGRHRRRGGRLAGDSAQPGCRWDLLEPLRQAGVAMYLTSDAFEPGCDRLVPHPAGSGRVRARGLGAAELISLVTAIPAQALDLTDRGGVTPGRTADLAVFDGDLRSDVSALSRPRAP